MRFMRTSWFWFDQYPWKTTLPIAIAGDHHPVGANGNTGFYNEGQGNTGNSNIGQGNTGRENVGAGNTGTANIGQVGVDIISACAAPPQYTCCCQGCQIYILTFYPCTLHFTTYMVAIYLAG